MKLQRKIKIKCSLTCYPKDFKPEFNNPQITECTSSASQVQGGDEAGVYMNLEQHMVPKTCNKGIYIRLGQALKVETTRIFVLLMDMYCLFCSLNFDIPKDFLTNYD